MRSKSFALPENCHIEYIGIPRLELKSPNATRPPGIAFVAGRIASRWVEDRLKRLLAGPKNPANRTRLVRADIHGLRLTHKP